MCVIHVYSFSSTHPIEYEGGSQVRRRKDVTLRDYLDKIEESLSYCNAELEYDRSRLLLHFSKTRIEIGTL